MSKAKRNRNRKAVESIFESITEDEVAADGTESRSVSKRSLIGSGPRKAVAYCRRHLWVVGLVAFLAIGVIGDTLKYLDESPQKQKQVAVKDHSVFSSMSPFLVDPTPTPVALSKEYVYAGSRLLAVEDANANAAPPADFAVWRPSNGTWYVLGGPGSQQTSFQWGNGTNTPPDKPVPGDYDGDGKTDFAVFRFSTGEWWQNLSANGGTSVPVFGSSSVTPAQVDYDGDGKTDAAYVKPDDPSAGNTSFYIRRSSDSSFYSFQFGLNSDFPSPADYDGDGKADVGVYRSSNHTFYSKNSSDGVVQIVSMGSISGTQVVSADYDGDGKADYTVWDSATGNWYIRQSTTGSVVMTHFGQTGDITVQNDYDADGRCDIAVWRPSTGVWWILQSHDGSLRTQQWGLNGDIPVPAYFRRS